MRTQHQIHRSLRLGVTLIELMIVLTLIGVITSIAVWKIDVARYQINGDQQVVGTALISAQRQAIAKQYNVIVAFDEVNHIMKIIGDQNNNGLADSLDPVRVISLGDRVRYGIGSATPMPWGAQPISFTQTESGSGLPAVTFFRNGSASESRGIYLSSTRALADPAYVKDIRAIHVERATGRAEWWHYDGTNWLRGF